jgi:hypothetical protein
MKATNLENLKRLKRALQKQKLERIDSLRMQVGRCDKEHNVLGEFEQVDVGELREVAFNLVLSQAFKVHFSTYKIWLVF